MKTHELARALRTLSSILSSGPDIELADLLIQRNAGRNQLLAFLPDTPTKKELVDLIDKNELPIKVSEKDGTAKILGKIRRLLEKDPSMSSRVRNALVHSRPSPNLMKVFEALLVREREK